MFGNRLKSLRAEYNLTQREFAVEFNIAKATISMWECGKNQPDIDMLKKISEYFNTSVDYLIGKTDNRKKLPDNLIPADNNLVRVPVLGNVRAGTGGYIDQNLLGYEVLSASDVKGDKNNYFFLKVEGDSMSPDIQAGDYVLVHRQESVDNGTLAVVCIDQEEAVVKMVYYNTHWIELRSFNPYYPLRRFEGRDVERIYVIGKVKESKRKW